MIASQQRILNQIQNTTGGTYARVTTVGNTTARVTGALGSVTLNGKQV